MIEVNPIDAAIFGADPARLKAFKAACIFTDIHFSKFIEENIHGEKWAREMMRAIVYLFTSVASVWLDHHPEGMNKTIEEIVNDISVFQYGGITIEEYKEGLLNQIKQKKENHQHAKTRMKKSDILKAPRDKVTNEIFNLKGEPLPAVYGDESMRGKEVDTLDRKKGRKDFQLVHINLDFSKITTKEITLDAYDRLVYETVINLYLNGNKTASFQQIYRAMFHNETSYPKEAELTRLYNSLEKMRLLQLTMNNEKEVQITKGGYRLFQVSEVYFLPIDIHFLKKVDEDGNQKITGGYIEIHTMPPLYEFSESRNQISNYPASILYNPLRLTDQNIAIEIYLRNLIFMNEKHRKIKLNYSKFFKECLINESTRRESQNKQKILKKVDLLLGSWRDNSEWIKDYSLNGDISDGYIEIELKKQEASTKTWAA